MKILHFKVKFFDDNEIYHSIGVSLLDCYISCCLKRLKQEKEIIFDYIEDEEGKKYRPHLVFNPAA